MRIPVNRRIGKASKTFAAGVSTAAALVSVLTFARAYGLMGDPASHLTVGDLGASWIGVTPRSDTATAIGDTVQLAATLKDRTGSVLVGAALAWSSDAPAIATVGENGAVIARAPGTAIITATVGSLAARANVVVSPRVASVRIAGDSAITLRDGERLPISARGIDGRGYVVAGKRATWRTADSTVAYVDTSGVSVALRPGRTTFVATVDGINAEAPVTVVPVPTAAVLVSGGEQRALAGAVLPLPVVVRILTRHGTGMAGARVSFRPTDSDAAADPVTAVTDPEGRARAEWRLGSMPGRRTLLAVVDGLDSAITVEADVEPVAANTRVAKLGDGTRGHVGDSLPQYVGLRFTDSTGRPLGDVPVRWTALDGGAVRGLAPRTDSLGETHAAWKLSTRSGIQRARVDVGSGKTVPPVQITAVAEAGAGVSAVIAGGQAQHGTVRAALPKPLEVRVLDRHGNPVPGVNVAFAAARGTVGDSVVTSDSLGIARTSWIMDRTVGAHTLSARADGVARALTVTATARAAPAANLDFNADSVSGVVGRPVESAIELQVTDAFGNPVADADVRFEARAGRVTPTRAATDDRGRVRTRWTLGTKAGAQTLVAEVRGAGTAKLVATARVPGAAPQQASREATKPALRSATSTKSSGTPKRTTGSSRPAKPGKA